MNLLLCRNVDVPFTWVAVKPLLEPPDPEVEAGPRVGPQERVQDVESAFSVEPQTGTLPANNIAEFVVTFAPPKVEVYSLNDNIPVYNYKLM